MEVWAGLGLQFLRSAKRFPEWATVVLVIVVSAIGWIISPEGGSFAPKTFMEGLRGVLSGILQHAIPLLATQGSTSIAANAIVAVKPSLESNPLVPVTDSM